ncbi:hypothetical protein P280DRAFT_513467 [Massarina eburnea CBS 473.64]|uniref:WSC domain-containing protein n=1 Tax=Massarina eburnea CBS 473.64 TaxID=1395130 RepID=A0A6A6SDF1_9PLEO|nr:hypothetical protein P280DRAFT_513467 [Massarina eburnea CBS 473.64]
MKFGALLAGAALALTAHAANDLGTNFPQTSGLPAGWAFSGCYSDRFYSSVGNRALGAYWRTGISANSGAACINICQGISTTYVYAGNQDNQCWCDTGINNNQTVNQYGVKLDDNYCHFECRGTTGQTCGSTNRGNGPQLGPALSIYTNQQAADPGNAFIIAKPTKDF